MNNYEIGKTYIINPHKTDKKWDGKKWVPYSGDEAIFMGWVKLKDKNRLPVFKFEFYTHDPKTCFVILENGKWVAGGHSVEEMMETLFREISFEGNGYEKIQIGTTKIDKHEFIQQAKLTSMSDAEINKAVQKGKYYTVFGRNGEIKHCPICKVLRDTSCSACGCGSCSVCNYRWSCMPVSPIVFGNSINGNFINGTLIPV
jgi:hypothetical protein